MELFLAEDNELWIISENFARHLDNKVNAVALRVAWSVTARDMRAIQIAQDLAELMNKHICNQHNPEVPELKQKGIGYDEYTN